MIEFLKQCLSDIPRLAKLDLDNEEYPLWYSKIRDIIEAEFGRDSSEYQDFVRCDWQSPMRRWRMLEGLHRNDYISNLKRIEVTLKGIIQKHEILGIESKPKNVAKQPESKSKYQKVWQWIETHKIVSILGALASVATIVGVVILIVNSCNPA